MTPRPSRRRSAAPTSLGLVLGQLVAALGCGGGERTDHPGAGYADEIRAHRAAREERLRAEYGWLSLIGLHWLSDGANRFGSDPANEVVLPADAATALAGTLHHDGWRVRLVTAAGSGLLLDGEPAGERELRADDSGVPDVLALGRLRLHLIRRGERFALRVKDPLSPTRAGFRGLDYFPVDPGFRVEADYRSYEEPQPRQIVTAAGTVAEMHAPGILEFQLGGVDLSLEPYSSTPGGTELFVVFRDLTSGDESYGAGRYLSAELSGDRVLLDFNQAYNPPCAFTAFATCPIPPPRNRLQIRITAGEKGYSGH